MGDPEKTAKKRRSLSTADAATATKEEKRQCESERDRDRATRRDLTSFPASLPPLLACLSKDKRERV